MAGVELRGLLIIKRFGIAQVAILMVVVQEDGFLSQFLWLPGSWPDAVTSCMLLKAFVASMNYDRRQGMLFEWG